MIKKGYDFLFYFPLSFIFDEFVLNKYINFYKLKENLLNTAAKIKYYKKDTQIISETKSKTFFFSFKQFTNNKQKTNYTNIIHL